MRRYSEVSNTPTPLARRFEPSVGNTITLPSFGRVMLRFIGTVKGKKGSFAGIELLDQPQMGKNSGEYQGIQYFTTTNPGAGLFMPLERLVSSTDDTPRRVSLVMSPGLKLNQTPQVNGSPLKKTLSNMRVRRSVTPISKNVASPTSKNSLESELQRVLNTKIVIEAERDNLVQETIELKKKLMETHETMEQNQKMLSELQKTQQKFQRQTQDSNERAQIAEDKLINQRKIYETQRKELLEVIDQVESQVNDNEQLYIAEMKKLQEELQQKQVIIDDLQKKLRDLTAIYEKQKQVGEVNGDNQLKTELENCKLTSLTQVKAIEQLRLELIERDSLITGLNKQSLLLKEEYIKDKFTVEEELRKYISKYDELKNQLDSKETELQRSGESASSIEKNNAQIHDLKLQHELETQRLNKQIKNLEKDLQTHTTNDKVQELEFKLENKESIINDLREQLGEYQEKGSAEDISEDVSEMKELLKSKEEKIDELVKQVEYLKVDENKARDLEKIAQEGDNDLKAKMEFMERELSELQKVVIDKDFIIKEQQERLDSAPKDDDQLGTAYSEIDNLKQEHSGVICENSKVVLLSDEVSTLKAQLQIKDEEIMKFSSISQKSIELEEKALEIEILREELAELKSKDTALEQVQKELESYKNAQTTNNELSTQIKLLEVELSKRPTIQELLELKSDLELMDQLRQVEAKSKDKEIFELKKKLFQMSQNASSESERDYILHESMQSLEKRPSVISQVIDGALQIYVPEKKDPVNGRKLWCGLCERSGHDSIDCPYENDIF
jgi:chromosome segregation ATPase